VHDAGHLVDAVVELRVCDGGAVQVLERPQEPGLAGGTGLGERLTVGQQRPHGRVQVLALGGDVAGDLGHDDVGDLPAALVGHVR